MSGAVIDPVQIWSQLGLQSSFVPEVASSCLPVESSRRQFALALRDGHMGQATDKGHRSASSSDVANLRAPQCVHTVELVAILIKLHFRATYAEVAQESSRSARWDSSIQITPLITDPNEVQEVQPSAVESLEDFEALLENDDLGPWSFTGVQVDAECFGSASTKTQVRKEGTGSTTMMNLADIALRSLICPKPMRVSAGLTSYGVDSLFHLASLAPAVFMPDYRERFQERAKLIPTIAKFLSQFLQQSGRSTCPEHHTNLARTVIGGPSGEDHTSQQKETLQGHLWMTLANGMKNNASARRLRPLHMADRGTSQDSPGMHFEDLVDTWCAFDEDQITCSPEENFEGLHLHEDEDAPESEDEYFSDLYDEVLSRSSTGFGLTTKSISYHHRDKLSTVLSSLPLDDSMLAATSGFVCSGSAPVQVNPREHAAKEDRTGNSLPCRTSKDLHASLDSSTSQLEMAAQTRVSPGQSLDMIGGNRYSHAYVSRMHPSYESDEEGSYVCQDTAVRVFEPFDRHDRSVHYPTTPTDTDQNIIGVEQDQCCTVANTSIYDTDMPTYDKSNRSSLTDVIGGDHLFWQMWTKRRPSMMPSDDDMLEMHAMYAQDPDMRLLETQKTIGEELGDEYMLDSETSNGSLMSPATPTAGGAGFMFPYNPSPTGERRQSHLFHIHKEISPASSQSSSRRPSSREKLSRGHSFLKRLSGGRSFLEEASVSSRPLTRDEPRDIEIKRRKTLADYEKSSDGEEMLLN